MTESRNLHDARKKKLLVVDDEPGVIEATRLAFGNDFEVMAASNEKEALTLFDSKYPDVVFLDIEFYGIPKGWDILRKMRERNSWVVILVTTGLPINDSDIRLKQADGFFPKPFERDKVWKFLVAKGVCTDG